MRRTATLSFVVAEDTLSYTDAVSKIAINKKIKLAVGIKNTLTQFLNYGILWFPQGMFVINAVQIQQSAQGITVSLTLKDKMSLLNGDCGGTLPATVIFHEKEDYNNTTGEVKITLVPMYNIIQEAVNHWGNEQIGNILIDGLDTRVKKVVRWTGDSSIYIHYTKEGLVPNSVQVKFSPDPQYKEYPTGTDIGYIFTDFTYPGELIGDAGNSIMNILDKIRDALGNFEYFYDIDGKFHFQEIKNYLNTTQASTVLTQLNRYQTVDTVYNSSHNRDDSESYIVDMGKGKSVYDFSNSDLIISYSNSPNYSNIKNDFLVWGIRKTATGLELPFRYHLAIDDKPALDKTATDVILYEEKESGTKKARIPGTDEAADPSKIPEGEQLVSVTPIDWRTQLYLQGLEAEATGKASNYYYAELANEWRKIYDIAGTENKKIKDTDTHGRVGFTDEVRANSVDMDFFLDFIDTTSALGDLSVSKIGRRTKVLVNNKINCMFEPPVNDICFITSEDKLSPEEWTHEQQEKECQRKGQTYCTLEDEAYDRLEVGGYYNGADIAIKELLWQYTNYNETITINCVPIYHLDVNQRITINNPEIGVSGDFLIKTISLPLGHTGNMTITANRIQTKI